jgi:hypothetical protein
VVPGCVLGSQGLNAPCGAEPCQVLNAQCGAELPHNLNAPHGSEPRKQVRVTTHARACTREK